MIIVLANEIADVDVAEFEKIGMCQPTMIAVPCIDVRLALKGMRATHLDSVEDCQHTMILTFEAPWDKGNIEEQLLEDPFLPGIVYRRDARDFVELQYTYSLGALLLHVYFLMNVKDCIFGYQDEHKTHKNVDYAFLWKEGLIKRVTS